MQIIDAFNTLSLILFEYLEECCPDNIYIITLKNASFALIEASPETNVKMWQECTFTKYREQLLKKDLSMFMDKNYGGDITDIGISKIFLEKLQFLREPMDLLESEQKDKIADYLIKLLKLSDKL